MKYIVQTLIATTLGVSSMAFADTADLSSYFQDQDACFMLYSLNQHKMLEVYNKARCDVRISPDSTFKVPLSLMAFDQKLITQQTIFKWDGVNRDLPQWNQDQTPKTWLQYSVVWVSQYLTPQLGMEKIKKYLSEFDYGNQDFSGNPGKNDGLTQAWLSSSLKISANEQLHFLQTMLTNKLPVSAQALQNTENNMQLDNKIDGWQLYGKTGTGFSANRKPDYSQNPNSNEGWFIGYMTKGNQTDIFITNFTDNPNHNTTIAGGTYAREQTLAILNQYFNSSK